MTDTASALHDYLNKVHHGCADAIRCPNRDHNTIREAASRLTQLTEERDDTNGFSWHERWRMAVDGANVWRDEAEALRSRVASLERVLREVLGAEWMVTHDWGGDRDALLDEARALLTEDRPAEPTVQKEKDAEGLHRAERDGASGSSAVLHREGRSAE